MTPFDPSQYPLDHLAVAVENLDAATPLYEALGFRLAEPEELQREKVRARMATKDTLRIELLEPHPAETGPIAKFLAKRGPGIHHIALRTDDLTGLLARLGTAGIRTLPGYPNQGLNSTTVAFLDPKATGGTLIELVESPDGALPRCE